MQNDMASNISKMAKANYIRLDKKNWLWNESITITKAKSSM